MTEQSWVPVIAAGPDQVGPAGPAGPQGPAGGPPGPQGDPAKAYVGDSPPPPESSFVLWVDTSDESAVPGSPSLTIKGIGNLLTANQASPTTPGAFVNLYNCTEGPAGVYTATDTVTACAYDAATTPVTVGQAYTLLATVTSASRRVRVAIDWLDSGGAQVGATLYGAYVGPGTTLALSVVGTAPAGATKARLYPFYTENAGSIGDTVTVSRVSFHAGASGQWAMPGVPITGLSPVAVNGAVMLSGTGSPEGVYYAAAGSTYMQTDAVGPAGSIQMWMKTSAVGASTGWVAQTWVPLSSLKSVTAGAADFAAFKTAIAAL